MPTMSRMKNQAAKGSVAGIAQQTPCKDSCQGTCLPSPTKANKITLGITLTLLLAWVAFLAALAMGK